MASCVVRRILTGCAAFVLVGCTDQLITSNQQTASPVINYSVAALDEIKEAEDGRQIRGSEDEILKLERAVPGLGGLFQNSDGELVVYVPQNSNRSEILEKISQFSNRLRVDEDVKERLANGRIQFLTGQFPFSQLIVWQTAITSRLAKVNGVVGIDADEALNRVRVIISEEAARQKVSEMGLLAGLPADALVIELGQKMVPLASLRGTFRPTGGGIQIQGSDGRRCTLGYNVTTLDNTVGFITAGHCAPGTPGTGNTGSTFYQPMIGSQYAIGTVQTNPTWNVNDPACSGYSRCTYADVLFATYTSPSNGVKRVVYTDKASGYNAGGSITATGWWNNVLSASTTVVVGQSMHKIGRTTGWTLGTVTSSCQHTVMSDSAGSYIVLCTDHVGQARHGDGDSGAPVFVPPSPGYINYPLRPYGILIGGGERQVYDPSDNTSYCNSNCVFFYSRWANIEQALGFSIWPNL